MVDYHGQQYIIESKIWHGNGYNKHGEEQLADYLEGYGLEKGYLISFCFNKNKKIGVKTVLCAGKTIIETEEKYLVDSQEPTDEEIRKMFGF